MSRITFLILNLFITLGIYSVVVEFMNNRVERLINALVKKTVQ